MNILFCIPTLGGGGAELQLVLLAEELANRKWGVHLAYLDGGWNYDRIKDNSNISLHLLQSRGNYDPAISIQLYSIIKHAEIDIVHTWLTQMDLFGGIAAIMSRIPFVISERSCEMAYSGGWKDKLRLFIGKYSEVIVANSPAGFDYWRKKGISAQRYYIPNIVKVQNKIDCLSVSDMEIIYAGRLIQSKNIFQLTYAAKFVHNEFPCAHFKYYGEGPIEYELELLRRELCLEGIITFKGFSRQWYQTLGKNSLFVSPSAFEGCPNAVIEAAAYGCPLVLSDIPAHRSIFDDSCALFVNGADPVSIASGISKLLNNPLLGEELALNASRRISEWTSDRIGQMYVEVYNSCMKKTYR